MDFDLNLTALFLAVGVTAAVGLCLPDALFLVGLTRMQRGIVARSEENSCTEQTAVTQEVIDQLTALGFVRAGVYWEQMPAHKRFHETILASRSGDCFAAIYCLFKNDIPRVAFKTAFADGAYVLTQNYRGGMDARQATLWAGGIEDASLPRVLAEHRRRVQLFVLAGHEPLTAATIEDHVDAEELYMQHPIVWAEHYGTVKVLFAMKAAFLIGGPWLAMFFGLGSLGAATILSLQASAILLFRYYGAVVERLLPTEEAG